MHYSHKSHFVQLFIDLLWSLIVGLNWPDEITFMWRLYIYILYIYNFTFKTLFDVKQFKSCFKCSKLLRKQLIIALSCCCKLRENRVVRGESLTWRWCDWAFPLPRICVRLCLRAFACVNVIFPLLSLLHFSSHSCLPFHFHMHKANRQTISWGGRGGDWKSGRLGAWPSSRVSEC